VEEIGGGVSMQRYGNIACTRSTGTIRMWNKEEIGVVVAV
jgi:hypothetical protein